MSERRIIGSWWVAILAFGAGMALEAAAANHRAGTASRAATPARTVTTPVAEASRGAVLANADRDTCDIQLD